MGHSGLDPESIFIYFSVNSVSSVAKNKIFKNSVAVFLLEVLN